jgi:hypothetical protein
MTAFCAFLQKLKKVNFETYFIRDGAANNSNKTSISTLILSWSDSRQFLNWREEQNDCFLTHFYTNHRITVKKRDSF